MFGKYSDLSTVGVNKNLLGQLKLHNKPAKGHWACQPDTDRVRNDILILI